MKKQLILGLLCAFAFICVCICCAKAQWTLVDDLPYISTDIHFDPGGNRYVTLQQGYVLKNADTILQVETWLLNEMGLVSVLPQGGDIYLHYTGYDSVQYVVRYDTIEWSPDTILAVPYKNPYSNVHHGGDLVIVDGVLYSSFGYGGDQNDAQDSLDYRGKIIATNLSTLESWIYADGLRNPFRIAPDPFGGIWCADVGSDIAEEVNYLYEGDSGGWPCWEADSLRTVEDTCWASVAPIYSLYHADYPDQVAIYIIGGVVFNHDYFWTDAGNTIGGRIDSMGFNYPVTFPRDITSMAVNPADGHLYAIEWIGKIWKFDETPLSIDSIPEEEEKPKKDYWWHELREILYHQYGPAVLGVDGRTHIDTPTVPGVYYKIAERRWVIIP